MSVAWTSDEHVGQTVPYAAGSPAAFFTALAGQSPDYYVSTGDVVLYPLEAEFGIYDAAIALLSCDTYHVPGNHEEDDWEADPPTWTLYDAHFAARHFVFDVGPYRLIGVHTRAGRPPDATGKCRIDDAEWTWFTGQLAALEGQMPIVFAHYQSYDVLDRDMVTTLANAGVKWWLSGHGHRDMIYSDVSGCRIVTGPTCSGTGTPLNPHGGYGWLDVYTDRVVLHYRDAAPPYSDVSTAIYTPLTLFVWD